MESLLQDVRYGVRMLRKSPGFTLIGVLMLGLGIGANTAIFTVVNAVLLRPLPYPDADRVVNINETWRQRGTGPASIPTFRDWQQQNHSFEQLAAWMPGSLNLQNVETPERISSVVSTWNLFSTLGVAPIQGRTFVSEDEEYGRPQVVVLGEALWRRRFNGDPKLVGTQITLDGESYTVIGIMPKFFHFPAQDDKTEAWVPLRFGPHTTQHRGGHAYWVVGRLKPGVELASARAEMKAIASRLEQQYPEQKGWSVGIQRLQDRVVGSIREGLEVLLGAVGLVLLIACANIANLLLARAAARRREVAVRVALGAGRARLARQFLTESVLLALAGGAVGMLFATWGVSGLDAIVGTQIPRLHEVSFDPRVFLFLLAVSLLTGILFGLAPALQVFRRDTTDGLKQAGASTSLHGQNYVRRALVVTEIALSLVLLIGAGLLLKTLARLRAVPTGLVSENVTTFHISLAQKEGGVGETQFYRSLLEDLENTPGVRAAGIINLLPIQAAWTNSTFEVEGHPSAPGEEDWVENRTISADYFRALGIPLVQGRDFDARDRKDQHPVVLINDTFARKYFPDGKVIGKHVKMSGINWEIIGVVGSVRQAGLDMDPLIELYRYYEQVGVWKGMTVVVSSSLPAESIVPAIRNAVHELDPNQPIFDLKTMETVITESISDRRMYLFLLGGFALLAMVVASAGIYGVISYASARRTQEFGLRIALGARPGDVVRLMLREGMLLVLIGVSTGVVGAYAATRVIKAYLFEVQPTDVVTFTVVSLVLAMIAMFASYVPARRAAKVDPIVALRYE